MNRKADLPWMKGDVLSFPPVANPDRDGVPDLWLQYDLHLELRFDEAFAAWRLCVSCFPRQMKLAHWPGEPYLALAHDPDAKTVARQVSLDTEFAWTPVTDGEMEAGQLVHVAAYGVYLGTLYEMIEEGRLESDWPALNGRVAGSLSLATPEGLDWILTTRESRDVRLVRLLPGAGGFVPLAPDGSLAATILDNLATAEGAERLDRLFVNAVEDRLKSLQLLDRTTAEVFRQRLQWLDP